MILRNLKSLIRRYPVAVVLNFTGLVAALLAFALIFLQADYELSFDKCHPTADRVFRADKKGDESLFRNILTGCSGPTRRAMNRCSGISSQEDLPMISSVHRPILRRDVR